MSASFPCLRPAPTLTLCLALAVLPGLLGACTGDDPEPQKLERLSPFDRGGIDKPKRDPDSPLRNPSRETPRAREGEQLDEAGIQAALAEAAEAAKVGNTAAQRNALRACANKLPADARCDGEMGLAQIGAKNRRATALYYLMEAARNDQPTASADLYHRVGTSLRSHGKYEDAIAALRLAIAREDTAPIAFELGRTLSLQPETLAEGADYMAQARAKDDRLEWIYEEAVLRGQLGILEDAAEAVRLFGLYIERAKQDPNAKLPAPVDAVEARAKELEIVGKTYPTRAEKAAQAGTPPPSEGDAAKPAEDEPAPAEDKPAPAEDKPAETPPS